MSITARRLAPLLIATSLATAGLALTTTAAHAAPTPTTAHVTTTESSNPLLDALRKSGKLAKIDNNNTANDGDTQPPTSGSSQGGKGGCGLLSGCGDSQPQPPDNDDTNPPTGGAGGTDGSEQGDGGSGNADLGPSQDSDYAIWTDPGPDPGPVVN
ncbi:hypothetical protein ACFWA6_09560 [Streptomyces sp. NPDC060020]|uniref:hypothetical protein n=1 Tax=Streptomyces sp. NPDC060020 TaxID=3347038 RepID=UPI0036B6FCB0